MLKIRFVITAIKSHNVCIFNVRVDHVRVEDLADAVVLAACPLALVFSEFSGNAAPRLWAPIKATTLIQRSTFRTVHGFFGHCPVGLGDGLT